jgi:hypothetical protein
MSDGHDSDESVDETVAESGARDAMGTSDSENSDGSGLFPSGTSGVRNLDWIVAFRNFKDALPDYREAEDPEHEVDQAGCAAVLNDLVVFVKVPCQSRKCKATWSPGEISRDPLLPLMQR